jgi:hypothetical protein
MVIGSVCAAAVALTALSAQPQGGSQKNGTDILHFFVRKKMADTAVESGASGRVEANQNQQGNANNQRLDILVKGLQTNTTYQLLALLDEDTNLTQVTEFATDAKGGAALQYRKVGNGKGLGKGKSLLPDVLNPLHEIRELAVFNSSTQAVLTADLTAPDKLQYLVKRDLSTDSVDAQLRIKATTRQTQFRLVAAGLNPTNDYLLVLNGYIEQTNSTDAKGKLNITSRLQNPLDILDLRTLAFWDSRSNVVLSTQLP